MAQNATKTKSPYPGNSSLISSARVKPRRRSIPNRVQQQPQRYALDIGKLISLELTLANHRIPPNVLTTRRLEGGGQ